MNILIYGNRHNPDLLMDWIESYGPMQYRKISFFQPDSFDDYLTEMKQMVPQIIFITQKGADGMEAVIAAKNVHPDALVVWLSDDKGFGPQSYRLNCTYFSAKDIERDEVVCAILKCLEFL